MIDWTRCLRLPAGFLNDQVQGSLTFSEIRENLSFPRPVYCTLGKRLYLASGILDSMTPDKMQFHIGCEELTLSMLVAGKYGATTFPNDEVVVASPEFPYRFYNFDGAQATRKPRSEVAYLVKRFVVFLPIDTDFTRKIEALPTTAFHLNRCAEAMALLKHLSPTLARSLIHESLITDTVKALTTKHALLGYVNYERLEFLGDAVLELLLALTCSSTTDVANRKANTFLHDKAKTMISDYLLDTTPTVNRPESLVTRGLAHSEANKVFADALEAIIGAIYLHAGLEPALEAIENLEISQYKPSTRLNRDVAMAAFRLKETLLVFRALPESSTVGELHLKRESLIAGFRLRDIPDMEFTSLGELQRMLNEVV